MQYQKMNFERYQVLERYQVKYEAKKSYVKRN